MNRPRVVHESRHFKIERHDSASAMEEHFDIRAADVAEPFATVWSNGGQKMAVEFVEYLERRFARTGGHHGRTPPDQL